MANIKYDKEKVLEITADYFFTHDEKVFLSMSIENVYVEIQKYAATSINYRKVQMPKFSQMRKLWIAHLSEYKEYIQGERLTTAVVYRIIKTYSYYSCDGIEDVLYNNHYNVTLYTHDPIICIIHLPTTEILDILAEEISKKRKKSKTWGNVNLIHRLCQKIKKRNPSLILAVIPQFNRMISLNKNGKISKQTSALNPVCDALCMFVKNTPEGHALVEKWKCPDFPTISQKKESI